MTFGLWLACALCGAAGAWLTARLGNSLGLVDHPGERSSHSKPTPKGGGIGILAGFLVVSLAQSIAWTLWVPATVLAVLGLIGDWLDIPPTARLVVQFLAALAFLATLQSLPVATLPRAPVVLGFAIFVVGTANFYNFMDGINGIAGTTGVVAFALLGWSGKAAGEPAGNVILAFAIAFCCLGFLPFNMPRARVFMGDVGSILLGFVFAALAVLHSKTFFDLVCVTAFLLPFYMDELSTMVIRLRLGENLLKPHRRHLYQLLANECGLAHWKVSAAYGMVQAVLGLLIMWVRPLGWPAVLLILALSWAGFLWLSTMVRNGCPHLREVS